VRVQTQTATFCVKRSHGHQEVDDRSSRRHVEGSIRGRDADSAELPPASTCLDTGDLTFQVQRRTLPTRGVTYWSYPQSRSFAELLIDCEEDRMLRAVLVGMLREGDRNA
jgi:hypothetical protein